MIVEIEPNASTWLRLWVCGWVVQGKFIVLAGLKNINGQLEFFNVDELETMATGEHYMATDVDWDPTGRQARPS